MVDTLITSVVNTPSDTIATKAFVASTYVPLTNIAYAEIFVDDGVTAQTVATGTTYTKLTHFTTNGQYSNCTPDATNDKITLTKAGKYQVIGSFSFSGTANSNWRIALFNAGTEEECIHLSRKLGADGDVGSASFSGIIIATTSTDIDVRTRHDSVGNQDITMQYSNLSVHYLGA